MKLLFVIFLAQITFSQNLINLGMEDSWPPFAFSDGRGYTAQIVKSACEHAKLKCIVNVYPYARLISQIENAKLDGGFNVAKQENRVNQFVFGQEPIVAAISSMYTLSQNEALKSLKNLPNHFKLGVIRGYEYGDNYETEKSRFKLTVVNNQQQLIKMLIQKKIDGILLYDKVKEYTISQMSLSQNVIHKAFENSISEVYVAFKKSQKSYEIAKEFDKGLLMIKKNGLYAKILNDHIY